MVSTAEQEISAYLFAGQGSQYAGMGKDIYDSFPESKAVFDKAEQILGLNLKQRCFEGPQEILKATNISQPAIVTVSLAAYQAFKTMHRSEPKFFAGLSLGEYSALIAAGVFSLEDGLRLVKRRGEIMEQAAAKNPGKMAAVLDLPFDKVKELSLLSGAEIANINAPGQIVISGRAEAVLKAGELCLKAGAKRVIELEVNGGFHSSLMFEASVELKSFLDSLPISAPSAPIVSNYTGLSEYKTAQIKENLAHQMHHPVKWEESIRFMLSQGVNKFFEFGPGKILKGLARRIDPNIRVSAIEKKEDILSLKN